MLISSGIDNQKAIGQNQITTLTIRILTAVGNSAGCERVFSAMGVIHKRCNRLHAETVHKTVIVRMDLKREQGLIKKREKQTFASISDDHSTTQDGAEKGDDQLDVPDEDIELTRFDHVAHQLVSYTNGLSH